MIAGFGTDMSPPTPTAFLSYARRDDAAHGGKISELRGHLERLIGAAIGQDFEIFQDADGIAWGQTWSERLDEALERSHLLIPILTPSFFVSEFCIKEVEKFLEMQRTSGRALILPVYFRTARVFEEQSTDSARELAKIQYRDLRPFRHLPLDDPRMSHELDILAEEIEEAVYKSQAARAEAEAGRQRPAPEAATTRSGEGDRGDDTEVAFLRAYRLKFLQARSWQDFLEIKLGLESNVEEGVFQNRLVEAKVFLHKVTRAVSSPDTPMARTSPRASTERPSASRILRWSTLAILISAGGVGLSILQHEPSPPTALQEVAPRGETMAIQAEEVTFFRDCEVCPEMAALPGGIFLMGSPDTEESRGANEGPQREVAIAPFAMGRREVTFDQWDACVAGGGCDEFRPGDEGWGREDRPVINVSWEDAQGYIAWLSEVTGERYRLPSEAEWEYAARAGTTTRYAFGDEITSKQANYGFEVGETTPVGSYEANDWGLYDMHGNVWEWVEDCWNESYSGGPVDGSAWVSGGCTYRVVRGGSWFNIPEDMRSANRDRIEPGYRDNFIGFRVARMLTP